MKKLTKTKKKIDNQEDAEKYLGLRDLASKTGLSESFIRKLKSEKNLPHYKIGSRVLFKYSEFDSWIKKNHAT